MNPIKSSKGYTLIELVVVVSLIGIMAVLAVPRFRYALLTDDLKSGTRKMAGLIKNIRNEAIRTQKAHYLRLDLESNQFWTDSAAMTEEERVLARKKAFSLPEGVRFEDVWFKGKGKKTDGTAYITFSRKGYAPQSAIHLGIEDGESLTLVVSPFQQGVKIVKDYIDLENT